MTVDIEICNRNTGNFNRRLQTNSFEQRTQVALFRFGDNPGQHDIAVAAPGLYLAFQADALVRHGLRVKSQNPRPCCLYVLEGKLGSLLKTGGSKQSARRNPRLAHEALRFQVARWRNDFRVAENHRQMTLFFDKARLDLAADVPC